MATDQAPPFHTASCELRVSLQNELDEKLSFSRAAYLAALSEAAVPGTVVVRVAARSADALAVISYRLDPDTDAKAAALFHLNNLTVRCRCHHRRGTGPVAISHHHLHRHCHHHRCFHSRQQAQLEPAHRSFSYFAAVKFVLQLHLWWEYGLKVNSNPISHGAIHCEIKLLNYQLNILLIYQVRPTGLYSSFQKRPGNM